MEFENKNARAPELQNVSFFQVNGISIEGKVTYLSGNKKCTLKVKEIISLFGDDDIVNAALMRAQEDGRFKVAREPDCGEWIEYDGKIVSVEYGVRSFEENDWEKEFSFYEGGFRVKVPFSEFHKHGRSRYIKQIRTYESFHDSEH